MGNLNETGGANWGDAVTTKSSGEVYLDGLSLGFSGMQGLRDEMEDEHLVVGLTLGGVDVVLCALFDGHGGHASSLYARKHLAMSLTRAFDREQAIERALERTSGRGGDEEVVVGVEGTGHTYIEGDEHVAERAKEKEKGHELVVAKALEEALIDLDADLFRTGERRSGATAVAAVISPSHIVIANLGDSRAVFARPSAATAGTTTTAGTAAAVTDALLEGEGVGVEVFDTEDHKPDSPTELLRINNAGGSVSNTSGCARINWSLAMSRSLGDFSYKANEALPPHQQMVSSTPDVTVYERSFRSSSISSSTSIGGGGGSSGGSSSGDSKANSAPVVCCTDTMLVLACDGLWDVCSSAEGVGRVSDVLALGETSVRLIAEELCDWALERGSTDNISCICCLFTDMRDVGTGGVGVGGGEAEVGAGAGGVMGIRAARAERQRHTHSDMYDNVRFMPKLGMAPGSMFDGIDEQDADEDGKVEVVAVAEAEEKEDLSEEAKAEKELALLLAEAHERAEALRKSMPPHLHDSSDSSDEE